MRMKSLREIGLDSMKERISWSKLPEVIDSKITDSMSIKNVMLCDVKFSIMIQEVVFNKELCELHSMARESVNLQSDPLPLYNRRHLVMIIKRLRRYSDQLLSDLERGWQGAGSVFFDPDKVFDVLDVNLNASFSLANIAYMEMLDEFRKLLKRTVSIHHDITHVYSAVTSCEKALGPLQRLASLRNSLRRIVDEEDDAKTAERASLTLDNVSGILDRCYEVLTSLHGPNYVADLDNILDFSLKLTSLQRKGKSDKNLFVPSVDALKESLMGTFSSTKSSLNLMDFSPMKKAIDALHEYELVPLYDLTPPPYRDNKLICDFWDKSRLYQLIYPRENVMGRFWAAFEEEEHVYEEIGLVSEPYTWTCWADIPSVIDCGILKILNSQEKALLESKFEIITSEVSYLKSLTVALTLFYNSSELAESLSETEMKTLFANLSEVRDCSVALLYDLAGHFKEDILLRDISNTVRNQAAVNLTPYITYCSAQPKAAATLSRLLKTNAKFRTACRKVESYKEAQGCSLQSFLSLPSQRITRLPVMFQAVLTRLSPGSREYTNTKLVIAVLQKLARACNESVEKSDIKETDEINVKVTGVKKKLSPLRLTGFFSV
ncbi:uncharacterized protein LOC106672069 [Cimex lectularius]|uniref:DH domain-containing protein n=1 Tax=Cimex lectularius TaxID=79782 RepID=A0A8I6SU22_CIMLE|nr:uncharacterized protein LOC106672069 [Cimex lectularius]